MALSTARRLDVLARLPVADAGQPALVLASGRKARSGRVLLGRFGRLRWDGEHPSLALREPSAYGRDTPRRRTYRRETRCSC